MTPLVAQSSMLAMTGYRRASSPSQYRREFFSRVKSARVVSGKTQQQIAEELGVKLNTYQTWEIRTLMPHQCIIPFCKATALDPVFLLSGTPFDLGQALSVRSRRAA